MNFKKILLSYFLCFSLLTISFNISLADFSSHGNIFANLGGTSASTQFNTIQCMGENVVGSSSGGVFTLGSGFISVWENISPVDGLPVDNLPTEFKLHQNYPNPFNPSTTIEFDVPRPCHVRIEVYNIRGEMKSLLVDEFKERGYFSVQWEASGTASGIYFCKIEAGSYIDVKKMMMIK